MKTLEEAIGCWTVNSDYNSLTVLASGIKHTANRCQRITKRNQPPGELLTELDVLKRRTETMLELTNDAIRRCTQIIETGECNATKVEQQQPVLPGSGKQGSEQG